MIALGVLVAQGATLLHLMMVPHTTCEHGELVEVHAAPRTEALAQKTSEPRVETAVPDERDHQHCDINARLHRLPEVNAPVGDAELLCIEPRATLGARPERRPVGLLSLAPKSSPPSA